jgi:hypothetical protein
VLRSTTKQSRSASNKRIAQSAKQGVVLPKNCSARALNKRRRPAKHPNVHGDQSLLHVRGGVWPAGTVLTRSPTLQQERSTHSLARIGFYSHNGRFLPQTFHAKTEVVWSDSFVVGLRFLYIEKDSGVALQTWLNSLRGPIPFSRIGSANLLAISNWVSSHRRCCRNQPIHQLPGCWCNGDVTTTT